MIDGKLKEGQRVFYTSHAVGYVNHQVRVMKQDRCMPRYTHVELQNGALVFVPTCDLHKEKQCES